LGEIANVPNASILRTTVSPDASYDIVQLEISDSRLASGEVSIAEGAAIQVTVEARIQGFVAAPLAHIQLAAVDAALEALRNISQDLRNEIQPSGHGKPLQRR
jgi:hypothetical protein